MKADITVSDYCNDRQNPQKMEKLALVLKAGFSIPPRPASSFPEQGIGVKIEMSSKYQTLYVKCSGYSQYEYKEDLASIIQDALHTRGYEYGEVEWQDDHFKVAFE